MIDRAALLLTLTLMAPAWAIDDYVLGPDSQRKEGAPVGKVSAATWTSQIFPGSVREYFVYVPSQYDPQKPACLLVVQDGAGYVNEKGSYRVPIVLDNLIHAGQMPVTIGIFINPSTVPPAIPGAGARKNRSLEYDSLGDRYTRMLLEEILPEVSKNYNITSDPNGRAIMGASSGGICAFTVAWERPNAFGKVISFIGSYTNIRGGHVYPALVRKTQAKPIRVFLQDGANDLDNLHGSWPLANQEMYAALKFANYDVKFEFGDGKHSGKHGGAILPDALRWIWRDWRQP